MSRSFAFGFVLAFHRLMLAGAQGPHPQCKHCRSGDGGWPGSGGYCKNQDAQGFIPSWGAGSICQAACPDGFSPDQDTVQCKRQGGNCYWSGHFSCLPTPTTTTTSMKPQDFYHCTDGDQHDWPVFRNQTALEASGPWSAYFKEAYGEIPSKGYPICTFAFSHIYAPLSRVGVTPPSPISPHCPSSPGEYYSIMADRDHQDVWSSWIWHPNLLHPYSDPVLPAHVWVEVMHKSNMQDGEATWMFYAPGTAIWFNLGETRPYVDHDDAVQEMLHIPCSDHECVAEYPQLYVAAKEAGLDSLQFLKHTGMACGTEQVRRNMAVEIVDLQGPGTFACGQNTSGINRYRAGWEASMPCNCTNTLDTMNCAGVGIMSTFDPPQLLL